MARVQLINGPMHGQGADADLDIIMKREGKWYLYGLSNMAFFVREMTEEEVKLWVQLSSLGPAGASDSLSQVNSGSRDVTSGG